MSRSRRKSPIRKSSGGNLKQWRSEANRRLRRSNRIKLHIGDEDFLTLRNVSDIWASPADGYIAHWNSWSEREKRSIWRYMIEASPELRQKLEEENDAWDKWLKWHLFIK